MKETVNLFFWVGVLLGVLMFAFYAFNDNPNAPSFHYSPKPSKPQLQVSDTTATPNWSCESPACLKK